MLNLCTLALKIFGKWSRDQIENLIEAVRKELFATYLPAYHKEQIRGEALYRVQKKISVRPAATRVNVTKKKLKL